MNMKQPKKLAKKVEDKVKEESKVKVLRKNGVGLDIGTSFINCAFMDNDDEIKIRTQRDAFFDIENDKFARNMLKANKANYIESDDSKSLYVIGQEAINFANVFKREVRRPLHKGVISTREPEALLMIKTIIKNVLGEPNCKNEICKFSVPAAPIDADYNVIYHENVLKSFIESFGFEAIAINEGQSVCFSELDDDGFTGLAISFGAGMVNCITGDTKIPLLDGSIRTIKELSELYDKHEKFWVYSCTEDGKIVPGQACFPRKTKRVKELYRIYFDNKQHLDCTGDHRIMMRDGSYKRADELECQDSIMPLYTKEYKHRSSIKNNYKKVKSNFTNRFVREHVLMAENYFGRKLEKGEVVHHKDFNGENNTKENLQIMTIDEHTKLHKEIGNKLSNILKGKTWAEAFGIVKARKMKKNTRKDFESKLLNKKDRKIKSIIKFNNNSNVKKDEFSSKGLTYLELYGEKKAIEFKNKLSKAHTGKKLSDEHKQKISIAGKNKYGKYTRTKCIKQKISTSLKGNTPWNKGLKGDEYLAHYEDGIKNHNHKVIKIEKIILDKEENVYDMTVSKYHNFAISSGIFVHNCSLSYMGSGSVQFSVARSGDWIDENAAIAIGERTTKMITVKENGIDLLAPKDRYEESISIFYRNFIAYVVKTFEKKLKNTADVPEFPDPISVVLAGGTSLARNFDKVFKQEIEKIKLPFSIKEIRLAEDQMFAVAKGCLYSALSEYEDE